MCNLNEKNPCVYEYLQEGGFTASLSGNVHSQISMNQIIETTINRFSKENGSFSDITETNGASERWVRINPFNAALREHLNVKLNRNKKTYDIEMGCSRKEKDDDDVKNVVIGVSTWLPSIWNPEQPIVKLDEGNLACENMVNRVLNAEEKGEQLLQEFISRFTSENSKLK